MHINNVMSKRGSESALFLFILRLLPFPKSSLLLFPASFCGSSHCHSSSRELRTGSVKQLWTRGLGGPHSALAAVRLQSDVSCWFCFELIKNLPMSCSLVSPPSSIFSVVPRKNFVLAA